VFRPFASKYANTYCQGVQAHITDAAAYEPISTWLGVLRAIRHLYPQDFTWLPPHNGLWHFDRLIGSTSTRVQIDAGVALSELTAGWDNFVEAFKQERQAYLLYA
jgi:beta-N-acetylhexosaminidase